MAIEHAAWDVDVSTGFDDESVCRRAMSDLLADGYEGYAALIDDDVCGVMCVRAFASVAFVPAHGLVVRPGDDDPTSIVVGLLSAATPSLIEAGVVRITIDHLAVDSLRRALHDAGFGGGSVYAIRATTPLAIKDRQVQVRAGSPADLDSIAELSHIELRYRYDSLVHALVPPRSYEETRAQHAALIERGGTHLIASLNGHDVGVLTVEATSPAPRVCPHGVYIGPTATRPEVRGRGVGHALVEAAVDHAREDGHQQISVDFESMNPLSRPFWLGLGFVPTGYRQRRVIALT